MRKALLLIGVAAAIVGVAFPASAHVKVSSPGALQGGYAVLTFRVPTESATASTTALAVQLPTDTPIASVSVQPHPGWSFTTKTATLAKPVTTHDGDTLSEAIYEIDWKADSADTAIKPGEFDQFLVSAGPLPKVPSIAFKAVQQYSDGTSVNWIETQAPGSTTQPAHPAPTLTLGTGDTAVPAATKSSSGNTTPIILSIVALVVAAAALGVAVVGRAKRTST